MTKTELEPVVERDAEAVQRSDRALGNFLKIGSIALVAVIVAFGLFYWFDQRTPKVPSMVEQQIGQAETAVRENPNNVPARLRLGILYHEQGRSAEGVTQIDEVLKVAPDDADAHMAKGRILLDMGNLLGATAEFKTVSESFGDGEFAHQDVRLQASLYWLGSIALKQDQPAQAKVVLGKALTIDPTDSDAQLLYGQALAKEGDHAAAIDSFRKSLLFVPTGWCEPYTEMASSFTALGQPEQASYAQTMATTCDGDVTAAKTALTALVDGPAGVDAMLGLARLAEMQSDKDGAIDWYRKALERDPSNIGAMGGLSNLGVAPDPHK